VFSPALKEFKTLRNFYIQLAWQHKFAYLLPGILCKRLSSTASQPLKKPVWVCIPLSWIVFGF